MAASNETALVKTFQRKIKARGGYSVKIHGGPRQTRGLLDLTVVYRGYTLFVEAKMPGGKPTDKQQDTINKIKAAGGIAFVADCWETIERRLGKIDEIIDG
jgi:hypothetical protein